MYMNFQRKLPIENSYAEEVGQTIDLMFTLKHEAGTFAPHTEI